MSKFEVGDKVVVAAGNRYGAFRDRETIATVIGLAVGALTVEIPDWDSGDGTPPRRLVQTVHEADLTLYKPTPARLARFRGLKVGDRVSLLGIAEGVLLEIWPAKKQGTGDCFVRWDTGVLKGQTLGASVRELSYVSSPYFNIGDRVRVHSGSYEGFGTIVPMPSGRGGLYDYYVKIDTWGDIYGVDVQDLSLHVEEKITLTMNEYDTALAKAWDDALEAARSGLDLAALNNPHKK